QGQMVTCAIVVHGGRGSGKSFLCDAICATGWGVVHRVDDTMTSKEVTDAFATAARQRPAIIVLDNLHLLIGREGSRQPMVVRVLEKHLDALAEEARTAFEAPRVVVVASCLDYLIDIPPSLQATTRFSFQVAIPIPDCPAREEILQSLVPPHIFGPS